MIRLPMIPFEGTQRAARKIATNYRTKPTNLKYTTHVESKQWIWKTSPTIWNLLMNAFTFIKTQII